jgi:curli biogenesis system outer membrane secretion channel CsgG
MRSALLLLAIFLPATAQGQPRSSGLPSVSIVQIDDMANSGQAAAFRAMIQTAINSTGKFRVYEEDTRQLERRQGRSSAGTFTSRTPGRVGGFEGADFLVYGSITSGSQQRRTDTVATIGRSLVGGLIGRRNEAVSCDRMVTTLAVDIRVVNVRTGQSAYAEQLNQQNQSAASCSGNAGTDVAALLRTTANTIAHKLVTAIYPVQVAAVQPDGVMILNYGEGTLARGQVLNLYAPSTEVANPANGTMMRIDGSQLGRIQITEVTPQFSRAAPVMPLAAAPPVGSIARPAPPLTRDEQRAMERARGGRR